MPAAESAAETKRSARRDRVVKSVLHAIFSGEVVGGDRLVEEELAMRLGVSRTPIREALRELAAIGVIWLKPNHGAMVRPFGPTQLLEIYHMRRLLESRGDPAGVQVDRPRGAAGDPRRHAGPARRPPSTPPAGPNAPSSSTSSSTPSSPTTAAANGWPRKSTATGRSPTRSARPSATPRTRRTTPIREHTAIIDRLLARQPEKAAEAMAQHIDLRFDAALAALYPHVGRGGLLVSRRKGEGLGVEPPPQARGPLLSNDDR